MTQWWQRDRPALGLLTDLYQLTMAYGYWKLGRADERAVFQLTFRRHPFGGGYTLACGLQPVLDYVADFHFPPEDLAYLATLTGNDGQALFEPAFLDYLGQLRFTGDLDAVPEGTVVFPHEPLLRVSGPILQGQLLESPLLNLVNFSTLAATKAARICAAAEGDPVVEFGLRRAQGIDGALTASRAAFVGGCVATSNVLAGKLFGIPVRGTHAHSWVMSFDDERASLAAYAQVLPNNSVFLVDTYHTLEGVRHAIEVGRQLRAQGHRLIGIRLDSGDLAYLSIAARKLLDEAGFADARIMATSDLDETLIRSLKAQGAAIDIWGVGTRLVTAYDQPALGGVYKLAALRRSDGTWSHKLKLSEQAIKTSNPGILQVRRYRHAEGFVADMIYDELTGVPAGEATMIDPLDGLRRRTFPADLEYEELLLPVVREGQPVYEAPALVAVQQRAARQLAALHPGIRRELNPHEYPVGLERQLFELKQSMVMSHRPG